MHSQLQIHILVLCQPASYINYLKLQNFVGNWISFKCRETFAHLASSVLYVLKKAIAQKIPALGKLSRFVKNL